MTTAYWLINLHTEGIEGQLIFDKKFGSWIEWFDDACWRSKMGLYNPTASLGVGPRSQMAWHLGRVTADRYVLTPVEKETKT